MYLVLHFWSLPVCIRLGLAIINDKLMSVSSCYNKVQVYLFACVLFSWSFLLTSPPNQFSSVILLLTISAFTYAHTASLRFKGRCDWEKKHRTKEASLKHSSTKGAEELSNSGVAEFHLLPVLGSEQVFL